MSTREELIQEYENNLKELKQKISRLSRVTKDLKDLMDEEWDYTR